MTTHYCLQYWFHYAVHIQAYMCSFFFLYGISTFWVYGVSFNLVWLTGKENCLWNFTSGSSRTTRWMKMVVFWVVAPCSLVEVYRRFRGPCCLHHQGSSPSETSVNFYQTHLLNVFDDGVVLLRSIIWTLFIVLMFCNHNVSRDGSSSGETYSVGSGRSSWPLSVDRVGFTW
jgi:hypothetical protein